MPEYPVRVPPVSPDEATDVQREVMGGWTDMNWVAVNANHAELYRVMQPLIKKLIPGTELPIRDRQTIVLRTLELCDETYERNHHTSLSRNAGMTDEEIIAARTAGEGLSDFDRTLVRAAEELVRHQRISDETWEALSERYSTIQKMEVVGLVGGYVLVAMTTKTFGIQVEERRTYEAFMDKRDYTEQERGSASA